MNTTLDVQGRLTNESGTIYGGVVAVDDANGLGVWGGTSYPGYTSQPAFKVYGDGKIGSPGLVCGNPPTCSFFVNIPLTLADNDGVQIANDAGTVGLKIAANGDITMTNGNFTLPSATSATTGIIKKGTSPFIHGIDGFGSVTSTFVGLNSGNLTNFGYSNTAVGVDSLKSVTGGLNNVAIGYQALKNTNWAENGTAVGSHALENSTGSYNTALGALAMQYTTSGGSNVAVGDVALYSNTTGNLNTGVGSYALVDNTTGNQNTGIGNQALDSTTSGSQNTAIGNLAGYLNSSGSRNIFIGNQAGYSASGSDQLFIDPTSTTTPLIGGNFSSNRVDINGTLYANPNATGSYGIQSYGSTAGGYFEDLNSTGYAYVANGDAGLRGYGSSYGIYGNETNTGSYAYNGYAGYGSYASGSTAGGYFRDSNNSGYAYVAYGDRGIFGYGSFTGGTFQNTSSGYWADIGTTGYSMVTNGGLYIQSSATYRPGGGSWLSTSDVRLKDIHGDYNKGLDDIAQLNPVTFNYKADNPLGLPDDEEYIGFIAQEVQKIFPEAITEGEKGYLTFDMHPVTVAIVNAIQELKTQKDQEIADLKAEVDELKAVVCELKPESDVCRN